MKAYLEQQLGDERKKLAAPEPGFSGKLEFRRDSDADAAFDRGFRVGIETAMKLYGGK